MAKRKTNYPDIIFGEIIGKRFKSPKEIEEWIRKRTGLELPGLSVPGKSPLYVNDRETDFFMDCTFGKDECGMDYADFTLWYLHDHARNYYITEADWSY